MNKYLKLDPWNIIEENFNPANNRSSESLFSIGNGYTGQRANFEEYYSGDSLPGNYMAGVYYPDPTKVGWWKNGYPEFYARIANTANWIKLDIYIDNEQLDLAHAKIDEFKRTLNMREGILERSFSAELKNGKKIKVRAQRFISRVQKEIGALKYSITPINFSGKISVISYTDTNTKNESSNWNEKFVEDTNIETVASEIYTTIKVKRNNYYVTTGTKINILQNNQKINVQPENSIKEHYADAKFNLNCTENEAITIYKYAANVTTRDYTQEQLLPACKNLLQQAVQTGFDLLLAEHKAAWEKLWQQYDIVIEGDLPAQQAIRFNIFQLNQTYTGDDARLNVGPKGFTGEKYGATTQWDSEAYCVPLYLAVAEPKISKNLLLYRYNHLQEAIKNATLAGFNNGAALFPMATVNGKECQNEWEITFEEIHRNGAIAFAIYNYVKHTGDKDYLTDYGLEVLIGISRFWSQRITFSEVKNKYVMLGVTGPNEYENNINNNWHTNTIAAWAMRYTITVIDQVKERGPSHYKKLTQLIKFNEQAETAKWQDIIDNLYYPIDEATGVFLQQDGYLDKEQLFAKDLNPNIRPINQHWSWDRILRSCFIKQADVLQGLYFFMDKYDMETIKKNYDFYEPRTVHESSLSPCIHAILAARIGYLESAYEMFLRTTRLDLDDYNHEAAEGCHITSMAGSWLTIIHGFGGMQVINGQLHLNPIMLPNWKTYSFKLLFRGCHLLVKVTQNKAQIKNESDKQLDLFISGKKYSLNGQAMVST